MHWNLPPHLNKMKIALIIIMLQGSRLLFSQEFVPFNSGAVTTDSIRAMHLTRETRTIYDIHDTINALEIRDIHFDSLGRMTEKSLTGSIYPTGTLEKRKYDWANRLVETSRTEIPGGLRVLTRILYAETTSAHIKTERIDFYTDGNLIDQATNITVFNAQNLPIDYKSINGAAVIVLHQKYYYDTMSGQTLIYSFTHNDSDSVLVEDAGDIALPFHDNLNDVVESDLTSTTEIKSDDGRKVLCYQQDPVTNTKTLYSIQWYNANNFLIKELIQGVRMIQYTYTFN